MTGSHPRAVVGRFRPIIVICFLKGWNMPKPLSAWLSVATALTACVGQVEGIDSAGPTITDARPLDGDASIDEAPSETDVLSLDDGSATDTYLIHDDTCMDGDYSEPDTSALDEGATIEDEFLADEGAATDEESGSHPEEVPEPMDNPSDTDDAESSMDEFAEAKVEAWMECLSDDDCILSLLTCSRTRCEDGGCVFLADCDDGDPCTIDDCLSESYGYCLHRDRDCDDNRPCTTDSCDPVSGECIHEDLPGCCTEDDDCNGDRCTTGTCVVGGTCIFAIVPDCDPCVEPYLDSLKCECAFRPTCDDRDFRTDDFCNEWGHCSHSAHCGYSGGDSACDSWDHPCWRGCHRPDCSCEIYPRDCDDADPCTADSCDPAAGWSQPCVHVPVECPPPCGNVSCG
jgi:hypothetical protein